MRNTTYTIGKPNALILAVLVLAMIPSISYGGVTEPALSYSFDDVELKWGPCPAFFPAGCQIGVLHGDPSKPNVDVFFRVPGNYDLPTHWHNSAERMVLVAGELEVTYQGQETVTLEPGMYAYGPARAHHGGRCVSDTPCVLFIAFEGPIDATEVIAGQ